MEAFLVSTGVVALAEMGDKTQLLALILAARYRRSLPIVLGILFATLANHALAAFLFALRRQLPGGGQFRVNECGRAFTANSNLFIGLIPLNQWFRPIASMD